MPIPWRPAKSLVVLATQVHDAYPGTPSPGMIGDEDHASRDSDHNPWVDDPASTLNVVTAADFYHRPALGFDAHAFAESLKDVKDPRVKYVISNRRIWSLARNSEGWRDYDGPNPHTGHCHVSVSSIKSLYDSTRRWVFSAGGPVSGGDPTPPPTEVHPMAGLTKTDEAVLVSAFRAALKAELPAQIRGDNAHDSQEAAWTAVADALAAYRIQQAALVNKDGVITHNQLIAIKDEVWSFLRPLWAPQ